MKYKRIIFCCCADYEKVSRELIQKLYWRAKAAGVQVELCPDLCFEAVRNPEALKDFARDDTAVAACHARAVQALFEAADVSPPDMLDLCGSDLESYFPASGCEEKALEFPAYEHEWKAWYPLIDPTRCSGCGKCIDYCLFGVYSRKDKKVAVTQPSKCKTNCPACARVCPQQAILFPKHPESPIDGGPVVAVHPDEEKRSSDQPEEELYTRLARRRQKSRKNKLLKDER